MKTLAKLYGHNLSLLTDLYQLTMAYAYFKSKSYETDAAFNFFFRQHPFRGGFTIAAGLDTALEWLEEFHFSADDLSYLASLTGNDQRPLFDDEFLNYLSDLTYTLDVDAVAEGTVVFPHEPLVRVMGPIIQCQLVETALLTIVNYQSLIATKAARICMATGGGTVLEFGLRRAHGIDGGLSASRAAYIGGVDATSNVLAGKLFGIPVKGTHAHSFVMLFDSELESFMAYADAMPNNCVFLVDTYDTLRGVQHAVEVGLVLRQKGHELIGIRLDSGDLAYLSKQARSILDQNGFPNAVIIASNDLDEYIIRSLLEQNAPISLWGVGTKLITAYDQPALGGVYKLSAVRKPGGIWEPRVKLSEQGIKVSNPGIQQVRRFSQDGQFVADAIYDIHLGISEPTLIIDPMDMTRRKRLDGNVQWEDLLLPVMRQSRRVGPPLDIHQARGRVQAQLASFHNGITRFINPHQYPVGLEEELYNTKTSIVLAARGFADKTTEQI